METCEHIIQSLGFSCHQYGDITVLDTPFHSTIDGDLYQLFIENTSQGYRITDYGLTLHHAETHLVKRTDLKAKKLNEHYPALFNEQGQINLPSSKENLPTALSQAFNALQVINQQLPQWKPKPETDHRFVRQVENYFKKKNIQFQRNQQITGFSGHCIRIPFLISKNTGERNLVQCIAQSSPGLPDWNKSYSISGQMSDLKLTEIPDTHRYVILEDQEMGDDTLKTVGTIIAPYAKLLRYSGREKWVKRFH